MNFRFLACCSTVALLTFLCCEDVGVTAKSIRMVKDGQEDEVDREPLPETKVTAPRPKNVIDIHDSNYMATLKSNDLLIMVTTKKYGCDDCKSIIERFYAIAKKFIYMEKIIFGVLDTDEDGDLFDELIEGGGGERDDFIPAVMLCKSEHIIKYKRPPAFIAVNTRMERDLPEFIMRMTGPDVLQVPSVSLMHEQVFDHVNSGVLFVLWKESGRTIFTQAAHQERYFVRFLDASHLLLDHVQQKMYNPNMKYSIMAYIATEDLEHVDHEFYYGQDGDLQTLLDFIRRVKKRRPGHKYDGVINFMTHDTYVPKPCDTKLRYGDTATITWVGIVVQSGVEFSPTQPPRLNVGCWGCVSGWYGMLWYHRSGVGLPPNITHDSMLWYKVALHEIKAKEENAEL
eukprot:PhF_6_TR35386/c0_g2_i3/m.51439